MKKVLVKFNFSDIKHGLIVPNFCVIQGGNVRGGNVPGGNCPGGKCPVALQNHYRVFFLLKVFSRSHVYSVFFTSNKME